MAFPARSSHVKAEAAIWSEFRGLIVIVGSES
jgi:hypothetical protein